jgi:uncharacterized protein YggU (UPF0235/DUF167 family)
LQIKVAAGASRNGIDGWLGDTLKLRVTAAPERGKANAAVERLVADAIGIPKGCVTVVAGHTSARKTLELQGVTASDVRQRLLGEPK